MKKSVMLVMLMSLMLAACNAFQGPVDIQVLRESRPVESAKELSVDIKFTAITARYQHCWSY